MKTNQMRDRQLIVVAGLVAGIITAAQFNLQEVLRWDRFQHTLLSAVIFFFVVAALGAAKELHGHRDRASHPERSEGSLTSNPWVAGFIVVLMIGLLKEFTDPTFDILDMVANMVGVGLGALMIAARPALNR